MQYRCSICGFIYDDAKEKVPFHELPDSWQCPLCGAPKSAFEPVEEKPAVKEEKPVEEKPAESTAKPTERRTALPADEDLMKLSAGQLAALFSNLARGCEKQYKAEESKLFKEIADYFTEAVPEENDSTVEALGALLKADIQENYPLSKATAEADSDRGAQRICVWGDKVTRMLSSLVEQYQTKGEAMLQGLEVWVCTVCGFIYIGEKAPELCPVCKVPSWKFEKVEGRA